MSERHDFALLLSAYRTMLPIRSATYVAIPMTTGPRFLEWWERAGSALEFGSRAYENEWRHQVLLPNLAAAAPAVDGLRSRVGGPLIDPSKLEAVSGWTQRDYHYFWQLVITEFVTQVVVLNGWELSIGSVKEVRTAVLRGICVLDENLRLLDAGAVIRNLAEAVKLLQRKQCPSTEFEEVLSELRTLPENKGSSSVNPR
jgi:hypothetical protein